MHGGLNEEMKGIIHHAHKDNLRHLPRFPGFLCYL